jgi:ferredoxin-like protein FixX
MPSVCQDAGVLYDAVARAVAATGLVARGGFVAGELDRVPPQRDGSPTRSVVMVGNVGRAMWAVFRAADPGPPDPLDTWTRSVLAPIARGLGAEFVHPSDEPYQPFQRWASRAADVWPSPIGLLIDPDHGLWHAYRGALLFPIVVEQLPPVGTRRSPCLDCVDQPCLSTCPVNAFTLDGYDVDACRAHVRSRNEPACAEAGCAARLACPAGAEHRYGADQMRFHMRAFVGAAP